MGLLSKLKASEPEVVKAEKEGKSREVRFTVFPTEGGRPYVADVEVDEEGLFELGDGSITYKVTRGSLWQEGAVVRGLVNEGNPLTINPETLTGDDVLDPTVLHGIARNNLWVQFDDIAKRKAPWKQTTTWALMIMGGLFLLMMFWQIRTTGEGFEALADALRGLSLGRGGGNHQDISPGAFWGFLVGLRGWWRGGEA